jgi:predicted ATPase/transcriptional regulator with XRE-family HTH domain
MAAPGLLVDNLGKPAIVERGVNLQRTPQASADQESRTEPAAEPARRAAADLGSRLRELRTAAGLSQRKLASLANIDVTYLSKLENGKQKGSEKVLRALAAAVGVDGIQLLVLAGRVPKELTEGMDGLHVTVGDEVVTGRVLTPPRFTTRFINQLEQINSFERLRRPGALVTVIGPPGCGKSRLAVELVASLGEGTAVSWLTVREGDDENRIASDLAVGDADASSIIVLDDADLSLAASANVARRLLHEYPSVTILATSRQRLGLYGEQLLPLIGLPVPDPLLRPASSQDLRRLQSHESVSLFIDRAGLAWPGFELEPANAGAVFDICRWLDGMPLAIELAALRLRQMTVVDLAAELDNLLPWLSGNAAEVPRRHASLETAFEWSFRQLTEEQRIVAARLCKLSTPFRREDAEEVASDDHAISREKVRSAVLELCDRSLLVIDPDQDGRAAYRWPRPIRQYGERELEKREDKEETNNRHARWAWRLAERLADPRSEAEWNRLAEMRPELYAAVHRLPTKEQEEAVKLLSRRLSVVLMFGGSEDQALVDLLRRDRQMDVFRQLGIRARVQGHSTEAGEYLHQALSAAQNQHDVLGQANAHMDLAEYAHDEGRYGDAEAEAREAIGLYQRLDDISGVAEMKNLLGKIQLTRDETDAADQLFLDALDLARRVKDRRIEAYSLENLGNRDFDLRRFGRARDRLEESLAIRLLMRNERGAAKVIETLALIESQIENHSAALRLLGATRQYRASSGMHGISRRREGHIARLEEEARAALATAPASFERELQLGAAMSLAMARELAVVPLQTGGFKDRLQEPVAAPIRHRIPDDPLTVVSPRADGEIDEGIRKNRTPLDAALSELARGKGAVSEAHRRLFDADLLALAEPREGGMGDLLSFAQPPDRYRGIIVPVFSGFAALAEVVRARPEWAEKPIVTLTFDRLRKTLLRGETLIVNPWLPSEYRFTEVDQGYLPAMEPRGAEKIVEPEPVGATSSDHAAP